MLFNSTEFLFFFLPITLYLYIILSKKSLILLKFFIVLSSLFFYGYWDIKFLFLFLLAIIFNFYASTAIYNSRHLKKPIMLVAVLINLFLIFYFKYMNFVAQSLNEYLGFNLHLSKILLPIGISFFTFQQITYLVDTFYGKCKKNTLLDYTFFVTFFPQVIAGPILHHSQILPQIKQQLLAKNIIVSKGLFLFSIGLFKKTVVADQLALLANKGFSNLNPFNFVDSWITSLSYTSQLYYDFSGYSDMALGLGLMFGIQLPQNFFSPYKSISIQEFWRRWHITLSNFLKEYVYIPLGGNRGSEMKTLRNLFITFLLGGIWHGAGWMFIIWGSMHGIALIIHRLFNKTKFSINRLFGWFFTFMFVNIAWIFFRADNFSTASNIILGLFSYPHLKSHLFNIKVYFPLLILPLSLLVAFLGKNSIEMTHDYKEDKFHLIITALLLYLSLINISNESTFLYFNF